VFLDPLFQWVTPGRWLGKSCGGIDGAEKKEELNKHTVSAFQHQFKIQNSKFKIQNSKLNQTASCSGTICSTVARRATRKS
jgi:hypothetical protein